MAAGAVARIDPAQTGAVISVLISALKSGDPRFRVLLRTNLGRWGIMPNPLSLTFSDCSPMVAPT